MKLTKDSIPTVHRVVKTKERSLEENNRRSSTPSQRWSDQEETEVIFIIILLFITTYIMQTEMKQFVRDEGS